MFTFASFVGSAFSLVTWSIHLASSVAYIDALSLGTADSSKSSADNSRNYTLTSAYFVLRSVEFTVVSVAKLLILDRMTQFAVKHAEATLVERMTVAQRGVIGIVLAFNAAAVVASLASTRYFALAAAADASAAAAFSSNQKDEGASLLLDAKHHAQDGNTCVGIIEVCFVVVLLIILVAFVATGVFVSLRIRHFLVGTGLGQSASDVRSARHLLLQTCVTIAVVFSTFLLRTVFELLGMLAEFSNLETGCAPCDPCQSEYYLITVWIQATPEVTAIVVALAEPLTLLVALWGMTSPRAAWLLNRKGNPSADGAALPFGARFPLRPLAACNRDAAASTA